MKLPATKDGADTAASDSQKEVAKVEGSLCRMGIAAAAELSLAVYRLQR
jgi:hypothetical protein